MSQMGQTAKNSRKAGAGRDFTPPVPETFAMVDGRRRGGRGAHPRQRRRCPRLRQKASCASMYMSATSVAISLRRSQRRLRWSVVGWSTGTRMVAADAVRFFLRGPRGVAGWPMVGL